MYINSKFSLYNIPLYFLKLPRFLVPHLQRKPQGGSKGGGKGGGGGGKKGEAKGKKTDTAAAEEAVTAVSEMKVSDTT